MISTQLTPHHTSLHVVSFHFIFKLLFIIECYVLLNFVKPRLALNIHFNYIKMNIAQIKQCNVSLALAKLDKT